MVTYLGAIHLFTGFYFKVEIRGALEIFQVSNEAADRGTGGLAVTAWPMGPHRLHWKPEQASFRQVVDN